MLNTIQNLLVVIFLIATMISMGVQTTSDSILRTFSDRGLIIRSLILNILIVPLIGYALYRIFNLPTGLAIGLIIVLAAPGSPFGLKLAEFAKGDLAYATALLISLSVLAIVTTPLMAQLLLPGDARASFNVLTVIGQLILLSLAPLIIGLQIRQRNIPLAERLLPMVRRISTISFVLVFAVVLIANLDKFAQVDAGTTIVIVLSSLISLALGWLLAGNTIGSRKSLAVSTGMRNFGLALLIAQSSFPGTAAAITVIAYALVSFLLCVVSVMLWSRQTALTPQPVA